MPPSPARFAELLTQAIRAIAAYDHKGIGVIQDELGYALGKKGGASIEYWRKGHVPPKVEDIDTLARELVQRGGLPDSDTLRQFLHTAGHPHPNPLLKALSPDLPTSPTPAMPAPTVSRPANPFIVGQPIHQPHRFFGREAEVSRIFDVWRQRPLQNVAVIGLKRSGKTSLLHYLRQITRTSKRHLRPYQRHEWLPRPERYRWVFVDFQDPRMGSQERLLRHLLTELQFPVPEAVDLYSFMDTVSDQLQTPAIILLDELGAGLEAPELDRHFWNSLRSLGTNFTGGNLGFLLTAHQAPAQLARDEGKTSPFFNTFGHTLELQPLTDSEARQLIATSPTPFDKADVEWILSQSQGWPCLLQTLCYTRFATLAEDLSPAAWRERALSQIEPCQHLLTTTQTKDDDA